MMEPQRKAVEETLHSLEDLAKIPMPAMPHSILAALKKKETNMNMLDMQVMAVAGVPGNNNDAQRQYLRDRVYDVVNKKNEELRKKFNLSEDHPETAEEAIRRIKEGEYTLVPKDKRDYWWNWRNAIQWKKGEEDNESYKKAREPLYEARDALMDDVSILDPKDGLEALRKFEKKTFH